MPNDPSQFSHSLLEFDFARLQDKPAYFKFTLQTSVDCHKTSFAISVQQKGNRIGLYRAAADSKFTPSRFNLVLMNETKIVKSHVCASPAFQNSLIVEDCVLKPGSYCLIVDPIWDESTKLSPDFKKIVVDVYSPAAVTVTHTTD